MTIKALNATLNVIDFAIIIMAITAVKSGSATDVLILIISVIMFVAACALEVVINRRDVAA